MVVPVYRSADRCVLIVPLWNWNEKAANGGHSFEGFNRTFMELKYPPYKYAQEFVEF